ncbi:rhomboid-related protein 2-like [Tubulanus polymorphus]|uniref:rhomboid-related protein 2-like n=1 Tax=Tubulanus polymorphus TaxID=672921 RepID=UPI003DA673F8
MSHVETGFRPRTSDKTATLPRTRGRKIQIALQPTRKQLESDRREIERRFKPLFQEYEEDGGIPLQTLRERLTEDDALRKDIQPDRLELLLRKADINRDGRLSYDEFMRLMIGSGDDRVLTTRQLTAFQRLLRGAVSTVVTRKEVEDDVDSYVEAYSCCPPPLFMILISIIEVAIFVTYAILQKDTNPTTATSGAPIKSPLIYNPYRRYEAWRYLTYMFIHQGYTHLIFNLIFQLMLGIPLELVHKWWRVGIVYSLGVIAGSLATSVTDPSVYLCGASGGCYAIVGAHFAIVIMNWEEMQHEWMSGIVKFLLSAPVRLILLFVLAGSDTGLAIWKRYNGEGNPVGFAAHFGGALAGLLVGIPVLRNLEVKPWEKVVWWIALIVYCLLVIFALLWNGLYTGFPEPDWTPCC